jgi:hypothetical protein
MSATGCRCRLTGSIRGFGSSVRETKKEKGQGAGIRRFALSSSENTGEPAKGQIEAESRDKKQENTKNESPGDSRNGVGGTEKTGGTVKDKANRGPQRGKERRYSGSFYRFSGNFVHTSHPCFNLLS